MDAIYKVKNAVNTVTVEGTISELHRDQNGKVLFFVNHANIFPVVNKDGTQELDANGKPKMAVHISQLPFSAKGLLADRIEKEYPNGALARVDGFISTSEEKNNIKFKARYITPALGLYKTNKELGI